MAQDIACITDNLKGLSMCSCGKVSCEHCVVVGLCQMVENTAIVSDSDSETSLKKLESRLITSPGKTQALQKQDHECVANAYTSPVPTITVLSVKDHQLEVDSSLKPAPPAFTPPTVFSDGGCLCLDDGSRFNFSETWTLGRFRIVSWKMMIVKPNHHQGSSLPETSSKAPTGTSVFSKFKPIMLKAPKPQVKKRKPAQFKISKRMSKQKPLDVKPSEDQPAAKQLGIRAYFHLQDGPIGDNGPVNSTL